MHLFLLFLAVPLIEIALFIQIGGLIGLFPTLAIVILTAIAGTILIRSQGASVMMQLRERMEELQDPTEPLAHGAMVLFAGALLLTPGFFTDAVGLSLMVPGIRSRIFQFIRKRIVVQQFNYGPRRHDEPTIIDGEFEDLDQPKGPSGWTRH
ncbi:MAG: FxsA family protein [Paracoccaceae bacterium]|nr:FxsA family protein [Paracoccaceae bacterium]